MGAADRGDARVPPHWICKMINLPHVIATGSHECPGLCHGLSWKPGIRMSRRLAQDGTTTADVCTRRAEAPAISAQHGAVGEARHTSARPSNVVCNASAQESQARHAYVRRN